MSRRKEYQHLMFTDLFGIRTKIKNFIKPRLTKAPKSTKVRP